MRLSRWMGLVGLMVGLGCLQVAERTAVVLKGYAVGDRLSRAHIASADVAWAESRVTGLTSPVHLALAAHERHLTLVAQASLADAPMVTKTAAKARPIVASVPNDGTD